MASHRAAVRVLPVLVAILSVAAAPASPRPPAGRIDLPIAADAEARLDTVRRMLAAGQWQQACPLLQAMIDENSGVVWDGRAYVPARDFATRGIAALPVDGRQAYETLYAAAAQRLLDEGLAQRSEGKLRAAAERYLNTESGPRAVSALAALRMDRGEFAGALRLLRSAGDVDPHGAAGRAIAVRTLVCLARLGRGAEAGELVRHLHDAGIDSVEVAGTQEPLDDLLTDALRLAGPGPHPGESPLAKASDPDFASGVLGATWTDLLWPGAVEPDWPSIPSTQPVACSGSVYVSRDDAVLAADAESTQLRWGKAPEGGPRELALSVAMHAPLDKDLLPFYLPVEDVHHWREFDNHGLSTLCCAEGRVYAVRMDPLRQKFPDEPWTATPDNIRLVNELQCLDTRDGSLLWSTAHADEGVLADRWFATAPTVAGRRAHVLTVQRGEVRAVCLDAASGQLLWDTLVGPVAGAQDGQRYAADFFLADCGRPAVADGIALYPTGRGLLAAFDALDGRRLWIVPYPRADVSINRLELQLNVRNGPWTPGPPLCVGGLCVLAPCDARHVVAFSLESGAPAWQAEFPGGVTLLGARDGRLYVQHRGVTCVDAASGTVLWQAPLDAPTTGLGALGSDFAYIPQQEGLRRVELATGRTLPPLPWPAGMDGNGNLVTTAGALAMCSPRRIALIRPATEESSATPPDPAAAALARMRRACEDGPASEALVTYLSLCRESGDLPSAGPWGSASLWTRLAEVVRARCVGHPAWAVEWDGACAAATERAAGHGDEQALEDLARWAPFERGQSSALVRLAALFEQAGRPAEARRAYAEVIARDPELTLTDAARAGLERLLGADGAEYASLLAGKATDAVLEQAPTAEPAWTLPGVLTPPERGAASRIPGKVLVLQQTGLACVDAATGESVWALPLRRGRPPGETTPTPSARANPQTGWGFPAFLSWPGRLVVSTSDMVLAAGAADGRALWAHDVAAVRRPLESPPLHRIQVIRWALRGLPVPPTSSFRERQIEQPAAWSRMLACRLEDPGVLSAFDPFYGEPLFRYEGANRPGPQPGGTGPRHTVRGARLAVAGGRLCVAEGDPPVVSVLEGRTGVLLARWQLPASLGTRSLASTPEGNVILADTARIFLFDLRRMRLAACIPVADGIDELLHADARWIVVRTLQGNVLALPAGGGAAVELRSDGEHHTVWAATEGGVVWMLDAGEVMRTVHYGPDRHFIGAGFGLRAVRLLDGQPTWRADLNVAPPAVVCEPVRCGPLWLLTVSEADRVRVLGFEADTGRQAFQVELPGGHSPQPVPLVIEGGRVVLGVDGQSVALQPGEALPAVPSPSRPDPW